MIKFSQILNERKRILEREKKYRSLDELKENIKHTKIRADFKKSLTNTSEVSLICEYKPASPSAGDISNLLVEDVIPLYQEGGASAISILTEETFFKSNIKNLRIASKISTLPLLRKDFIIDEYQIYESRSCGASAVLLMVDIYPDLRSGIEMTHYLGMDALVECKNKGEIDKALKSGAEIIGINNRNFKDFTIDLKRTQELARYVPSNKILVSESGVKSAQDIQLLKSYGADAVLVGTSLMAKTGGPGGIVKKMDELSQAVPDAKLKRNDAKVKICGITRSNDLRACQKPGVDFIGFINIERSKRFLDIHQIAELTSFLNKEGLNNGNSVLVIEPESPEEVQIKVEKTGIRNIQLHSLSGKEISKIKTHNPLNNLLRVTRVIGLSEKIDGPKKEEIKEFSEVCDGILFDYENLGKTGGTGRQIPLSVAVEGARTARKINPQIKLGLAGGMDAERIKAEGRTIKRYFDVIDLNSGVEDEPGIKNPGKIEEILKIKG